MVEGAETLNICIKKTCYEYELDGGTSIISTNSDPPLIPTTSTLRSQRAYIRVWWHPPYDH